MPRTNTKRIKPALNRRKKTVVLNSPASFYVAPTTPFIPKYQPSVNFAIKATANTPSPHLVDLRVATAARPHNPIAGPVKKKERAGFTQVSVPRTISQNPDRNAVWDQLAIVALAQFVWGGIKLLLLGLGKLVILPLTAGLALVERFDADKATALETEPVVVSRELAASRTDMASVPIKTSEPAVSSKQKPVSSRPRPFKLRRALISFAGTSLAIILPLQGLNAFRALQTVKARAEAAQATSLGVMNGTSSLADAQLALNQAEQSVADLGQIANALLEKVPQLGGQFRSGKDLLAAGADLASAATQLSQVWTSFNDPTLDLTAKIARAQEVAAQAEPLLAAAKISLENADELPAGLEGSGSIDSLRSQVTSLDGLTQSFLTVAPALRDILGEGQARRYLILFQNNAELRPTGGFIGSFALVDVDRGAIKKVEVPAGGPYDLQGSLKASVLSPEPLRLIAAKWEFQDANWFPDFPTSAQKLAWFYGQSGGPSVDGVIAVNAPVLAALLDAVGPINMPEYQTVATGTTVLATAQEIVESPAARESGKPKQFIADLLPRVLDKMMTAKGGVALEALKIFAQSLGEKDIQLWFADGETEKSFDALGWTGRLPAIPAGFDSVGLVRTNIAGAKTDTAMKTLLRHESVIAADGSVTDHVTVTLSHEGRKGDQFTGVRNVTYLRLYVPQGSRLEKASGDIRPPGYSLFDLPPEGCRADQTLADVSGAILHDPNSGTAVNNEFGRTVFGVWTQTDPGASSTVSFDYHLPFSVNPVAPDPNLYQKIGLAAPSVPSAAFGLLIDQQSGAQKTEIQSTLKLPAGWYPSLTSPEGMALANGWSFTSEIKTDRAIGAIISK